VPSPKPAQDSGHRPGPGRRNGRRNRIGPGLRAATAATRFGLSLANRPRRRSSRCSRRMDAPPLLGECRPGSAPAAVPKKTPTGTAATRLTRPPQSRPFGLAWERNSRSLAAGYTHVAEGPAPLLQAEGISRSGSWEETLLQGTHEADHRKLHPLLAVQVIRVTLRLASVSLLRRTAGQGGRGPQESPPGEPSSFFAGYWMGALTSSCRLRRRSSVPSSRPSVIQTRPGSRSL